VTPTDPPLPPSKSIKAGGTPSPYGPSSQRVLARLGGPSRTELAAVRGDDRCRAQVSSTSNSIQNFAFIFMTGLPRPHSIGFPHPQRKRSAIRARLVYHGQRRGYCRDMMEATWFMLIGAVVLIVGLVLVRRESKSKGRWGTGSFSASCPRCGARLPTLRKVASIGEAMWGGWTCEKCACKVDRYGREREG
jgi:hypothetical protein